MLFFTHAFEQARFEHLWAIVSLLMHISVEVTLLHLKHKPCHFLATCHLSLEVSPLAAFECFLSMSLGCCYFEASLCLKHVRRGFASEHALTALSFTHLSCQDRPVEKHRIKGATCTSAPTSIRCFQLGKPSPNHRNT